MREQRDVLEKVARKIVEANRDLLTGDEKLTITTMEKGEHYKFEWTSTTVCAHAIVNMVDKEYELFDRIWGGGFELE